MLTQNQGPVWVYESAGRRKGKWLKLLKNCFISKDISAFSFPFPHSFQDPNKCLNFSGLNNCKGYKNEYILQYRYPVNFYILIQLGSLENAGKSKQIKILHLIVFLFTSRHRTEPNAAI